MNIGTKFFESGWIGKNNLNQDVINKMKNPEFFKSDQEYPGQRLGLTMKDWEMFIRKSKRTKGFSRTIAATGTSVFSAQLSGTANLLLGFSMFSLDFFDTPASQARAFSLKINNELLIETVHPIFFSNEFTDEEYYFFPRPLSGQDDINEIWNFGAGGQQVFVITYYYI